MKKEVQQEKETPVPAGSWTIKQWCARHSLSESKYYELKKEGKTPRTFLIGTSYRISPEADAEWVKSREAAAQAEIAELNKRREAAA